MLSTKGGVEMTAPNAARPLLEARKLCSGYGAVPVLKEIDLTVGEGEVVALLGANGAGKTTTLLTLSGDHPVTSGEVLFDGEPVRSPLHQRARDGLAYVTEERSVFMGLTTRDNLRVGRCDVDRARELFPELDALMNRRAGLLSGGEQQILAVARALARRPKVLLADEISLGLAPKVVTRLLAAIRAAADEGLGVLLVEQHVRQALAHADRVYVLRRGEVILSGTAKEVAKDLNSLQASYLANDAPAAAAG
jgi:ABC-type branched-subunit amino acid transport system ATPase component